jgi:predicted signal transduction protein with EAL and GGDEF domain
VSRVRLSFEVLVVDIRDETTAGDEFAALIVESDAPQSAGTDVARWILDSLQTPFDVSGHQFRVHASLGIASYCDGARYADQLIRNADVAMYSA